MALTKQLKDFYKKILTINLDFLKQEGINNVKGLNEYKVKKIIEEPLWKNLECNGKTNQRYISQGVYEIRVELDRLEIKRNQKSIWTPNDIDTAHKIEGNKLKELSDNFEVQLEHVVEMSKLVEILIKGNMKVSKVLDKYNIGCTVLKKEHCLLPNNLFDRKDVWIRYRNKLNVYDTKEEKWVVGEGPFAKI